MPDDVSSAASSCPSRATPQSYSKNVEIGACDKRCRDKRMIIIRRAPGQNGQRNGTDEVQGRPHSCSESDSQIWLPPQHRVGLPALRAHPDGAAKRRHLVQVSCEKGCAEGDPLIRASLPPSGLSENVDKGS